MEIDRLNSECHALILSEQALQQHYRGVHLPLPTLLRTPEPLANRDLKPFPIQPQSLYKLLRDAKSNGRFVRPQVVMSKHTLKISQLDYKMEEVAKPKTYKISDPRFTSPMSTLKTKPNKKPDLSFFSSAFTLCESTRSQSCERGAYDSRISPIFADDKVKRRAKVEKVDSQKVHSYAAFFPTRGRKHVHCFRKTQKVFEFFPPSSKTACKRVHSLKSMKAQKLKINIKDLQSLISDERLKLADDDDEFKCVVEGEWTNPVIHL